MTKKKWKLFKINVIKRKNKKATRISSAYFFTGISGIKISK